ncbi:MULTISPECIES: TetR/AcrR family transcriptional regulator [Anoxybacillaceae]|jgi:AcrR family transcriptional regulator|uniref:Regulatory protein TetR n=1 Tax=Parageobacillus genomosp. 1 TaxID=1295642 RepID=A0ABC9VJ37_9BACL|nr:MULTISPECIES: TetR/AcrR family transcriptional regulator [Parageobacillus]EZP78755.1 regulatory protein TetR [Parageobacillus genomosp. 1]
MSPRIGLDLSTILQTATEIADKDGLDAVTLATLAKKLGVRPPSLYNHIEGLHGLRKQLAVYGLEQLYNTLAQAAIGRSGDDAVHALGKAYVTFARTHPGLYEATLQAPDSLDPDIQRAGREIVNLTLRVLHAYDLDDETALHAVRGLRSMFHGFASLEQKGEFRIPLDHDVTLRFLIDTFLTGIRRKQKSLE